MIKAIKWTLLIGLVLVGVLYFLSTRPVTLPPGVMAPDAPLQEKVEREPVIRKGDFSIFPAATFQIEAKVLSRKRYRTGTEAELSPMDLALGWGPMSDQNVVDKLSVSQSGRWYRWSCGSKPPIPIRKIETHSANMHIIPASDAVEKVLKSVRVGQVIHIDGYLVRVTGKDGWRWNSSMSREDTGDGACEIVYAKDLFITHTGSD